MNVLQISGKKVVLVTADDNTGYVDIDTDHEFVAGAVVQITRSNVVVGGDAVITYNTSAGGYVRLADGSTYKLTAGDVVTVVAWPKP
jgi:hypothetical protein